ncbi:MAG: DUF4837 family protein [Candidatus Marinimicrobia bacterium]|nr:DUF4837 family protein [Candidatus Neomarinimicrobiota bacterium]
MVFGCGLLSILIIIGSINCGSFKRRAVGIENQILIFVSDEDKPYVQSLVDSVFGRVVYTPRPEPIFELIFPDPNQFGEQKFNHNILVISLFNPPDSTGDILVRSLLPKDQYNSAKKRENHIFARKDRFSIGQVIAILAAENIEILLESIEEKERWLFDQFNIPFLERQKKHMFKRLEQKELSREFSEKYGWRMRIQHDYLVMKEDPEHNFIWIGRAFPFRWISVKWIDNASEIALNTGIATDMIKELPQYFTEKIRFIDYHYKIEETFFNQWQSWRAEGLWEHRDKVKGGPFVSYVFYDGVSDRIYHINFLIYNPGNPKIVLLRQMDIMVHTFSVIGS